MPICKLVKDGEITIAVSWRVLPSRVTTDAKQGLDDELDTSTAEHLQLRTDMNLLIKLTNPIARAIVCLESPHSTAADVFVFFAAALLLVRKNLDDLMKSKKSQNLPMADIIRILTKRFDELINSKNGHDLYFTATLLHPCEFTDSTMLYEAVIYSNSVYVDSDILRKDINPLVSGPLTIRLPPKHIFDSQKPPRHISETAYQRGGKYLYTLLTQLKESGHHQELELFSCSELEKGLAIGWDAYSRNIWPYNTYIGGDVLEWWTSLLQHPCSYILAVCPLTRQQGILTELAAYSF